MTSQATVRISGLPATRGFAAGGMARNPLPRRICPSMASDLPQTVLFERSLSPAELSSFHVSTYETRALRLTETLHPAGFRVPRHAHRTASFYFLLKGALDESYGTRRFERTQKQVAFSPAGAIHSNVFHASGGRCLIIDVSLAAEPLLCVSAWLPPDPSDCTRAALQFARKIHVEFTVRDQFSSLCIDGAFCEMLAAIGRDRYDRSAPRWVQRTRMVLDERFAERLPLSSLAAECGVHPVHLCRTFKHTYGCSVGDYLRQRRVSFAADQLARTRATLAEVAAAAGFCDQSHLCKTFRSVMGVSPSAFRAARA